METTEPHVLSENEDLDLGKLDPPSTCESYIKAKQQR